MLWIAALFFYFYSYISTRRSPNENPLGRVLLSCGFLLMMGLVFRSQAHAGFSEPDRSLEPVEPNNPFVMFASIPDHVDAAVALNNPAGQLLLNDTGRSVRKAMGVTGLFGQTMGAFDALAGAFHADTESTIKGLLSQRTVIIWDEIGPQADSLFHFTSTMDTNWAVISEIESGYLDELRKRLKPVKRRLAHGQVVYAIEQGRYELILLEGTHKREPMVLLAPSKGSALLDRTLADQLHGRVGRAEDLFVDRHQSLVDTLGHDHPQWLAAWLVHNERVLGMGSTKSGSVEAEHSTAMAGVLTLDGQEAVVSLATDHRLADSIGEAPIGLLSAAGEDAILAVALAQIPSFVIESNLISAFYGQGKNGQSSQSTPADGGQAGLILLTEEADTKGAKDTHGSTVLTVLVEGNPPEEGEGRLAARVDDFVRGLFVGDSASRSPDYRGRFPKAVRTHRLRSDSSTPGSADAQPSAWLGDETKFSWISAHHRSKDAMIASVGPSTVDTADRVKWMRGAIESFDAIPDHTECSGAISSGYFYPSRASDLLSSGSGLDLAISKLFERVEWDITRMQAGVRGTIRIEFTRFEQLSNLGASSGD